MKFAIGDKVKFIDAVGGGEVIDIQDDETVVILNEDDFEIPVKIQELMLADMSQSSKTGSPKPPTPKTVEVPNAKLFKPQRQHQRHHSEINLVVAFVPMSNPVIQAQLGLYLLNDSDYPVQFQISVNANERFQLLDSGLLEPNTQIQLTLFNREDLNIISRLLFQGFIVLENFKTPYPVIEKEIGIRPSRFTKINAFKESSYFKLPTIEYLLFHSDFETEISQIPEKSYAEVVKQDSIKEVPKTYKKSNPHEKIEVDLHIENLLDNHNGLSNAEIINIQLTHFQKELESALAKQAERIIFIHGVGTGKLRQELIKKLNQEYPKLSYQDASFKEYGYGATMVFLR